MNTLRKTSAYLLFSLFIFGLLGISCSGPFRKGMKKFEQGAYQSAIPFFEKAATGAQAPKAHFLIGESYRLSNRIGQAADAYGKALNAGYNADEALRFHYAMALKASGNYTQAAEQFKQYSTRGTDFNLLRRAKAELAITSEALQNLQKGNPYMKLTNCDDLNTNAAEFSPMLFQNRLYFTSNRTGGVVYEATGTPYTDLYVMTLEGKDKPCSQQIAPVAGENLNLSGFHEASVTFSPDGRSMVFARSNSGKKRDEQRDVDLYISTTSDGGLTWSEPEPLPLNLPESWDACPAFSSDGKTLYFASNRPGGQGGIDLWRATQDSRGQWSKVANMGNQINTPGNDMFPYAAPDGRLFFSSDGHPGLGGLDLFVATRSAGQITLKNLGAPFNSSSDDLGIVWRNEESGYFASNRPGGKGDDDIYFFKDETPKTKEIIYFLAGTAFSNEEGSQKLLPNVTLELINAQNQVVSTVASDSEGKFRFQPQLNMGQTYRISAQLPEYLKFNQDFATAGKEVNQYEVADQPQDTVEIVLETAVVLTRNIYQELLTKREISLNNILYDFDDFRIRPDAAIELDKLVAFLESELELRVELGSHTDSRGSDRYNERLSQQRAQAAVEYIISKGIDAARIVAKGYGESKLLVEDAQTEEEHQLNRRTTVTILD